MVGAGSIDFPPGNSVVATIFNNAVKLLPLWIQTDALASGIKTYYESGKNASWSWKCYESHGNEEMTHLYSADLKSEVLLSHPLPRFHSTPCRRSIFHLAQDKTPWYLKGSNLPIHKVAAAAAVLGTGEKKPGGLTRSPAQQGQPPAAHQPGAERVSPPLGSDRSHGQALPARSQQRQRVEGVRVPP